MITVVLFIFFRIAKFQPTLYGVVYNYENFLPYTYLAQINPNTGVQGKLIGPGYANVEVFSQLSCYDSNKSLLYVIGVDTTGPAVFAFNLKGVIVNQIEVGFNFIGFPECTIALEPVSGDLFVVCYAGESGLMTVVRYDPISQSNTTLAEIDEPDNRDVAYSVTVYDPVNQYLWVETFVNFSDLVFYKFAMDGSYTEVVPPFPVETLVYDPVSNLLVGTASYEGTFIFITLDSKTNSFNTLGFIDGYQKYDSISALDYKNRLYYTVLLPNGGSLNELIQYSLTTNLVESSPPIGQNANCFGCPFQIAVVY